MKKQYRLEIPAKVEKKDCFRAANLSDYDGMEFCYDENGNIWHGGCHWSATFIPKDWLKEIKQPMTLDDWIEKRAEKTIRPDIDCAKKDILWTYSDIVELYKWTIENERLKHDPKQGVAEAFNDLPPNLRQYGSFSIFENGWKACDKSRGYDD